MVRKDRNPIDPTKPALIVTYGSCPGKVRALDGELLVIGRAPACDLVLNSPEVSPVHCLVVKTASGWLLRNTNPRVGTHLNGQLVQDILLNDDDSLQIGTFSFKVHLPRPADAPALPTGPSTVPLAPADEPKPKRLLNSRHKVVRLAWNLRRRLLQQEAQLAAERQAFAQRQDELDQRGQAVDARQRECQNLLLMLEEQEEEVTDQRQAVLDAAAEFEASRRLAETELEARKAELDAYAHHLRQLHHDGTDAATLRAENERLRQELDERPTLDERHRTEAAVEELAALRQEHEQTRRRLAELEQSMPDHVRLDDHAAALEAELDTLRERLETRDDELRAAAGALQELQGRVAGLETVSADNEELLRQVVQLEEKLKQGANLERHGDELRVELETLRSYTKDRDVELERLWQAEAVWGERETQLAALEPLRQENERLQAEAARRDDERRRESDGLAEQLRETEDECHRLRQQGTALQADVAKLGEAYEAACLRLREQERQLQDKARLEKEGKALGEELHQLRDKLQTARAERKRQADQLADIDALRVENEQLQLRVRELGGVLDEKVRLEIRLEEQRQELVALRERLQAKDDELRRLQVADTLPPEAREQAELVAAVETLLRENEDFRKRLLNQARALQDMDQVEQRLRGLQVEADTLRAQLQLRSETADLGLVPETAEDNQAAPVQPNKYLRAENEELKAKLEIQAAALLEQQQLQELTTALRAEVGALRGRGEGRLTAVLPHHLEPDAGWRELIAPATGSESLLQENDALRNRLAEQQSELTAAARLRAECDALRTQLHNRAPRTADDTIQGATLADDERARLTARIVELEGQIRERDERLAVLEAENANLKQNLDYDSHVAHETQLRHEREALLRERAKLEQELGHLREDRAELDAAAQAAELHMSKERVHITREWAELNRKREEFRMEMETLKRDTVRDNLERVRRIKEETQSKRNEPLSALVAQRIGERRKTETLKAPE